MNWIYWIASILIGLTFALIVYKKDKQKTTTLKWLPATLRGCIASLTAFLLLAPLLSGFNKKEEQPTIIWLQDISTSINNSLGGFKEKYFAQQQATLKQLQKKYDVQVFGFGDKLTKDSILNYHQKSTDINTALEQIAIQYQDKNLGAIILASDGIINQGNNPNFLQLENPIRIYSIALGDSTTPKDIKLQSVYANKSVAINNNFEIFADIIATGLKGKQSTATLTHNGKTIATQKINITSNDFANSISFVTTANQAGTQQYTISIANTDEETNLKNNAQSVIVEVLEKKHKILLFAAAPHPDISVIKKAIKEASQFELNIITNGTLPNDVNNFDMIIAYQTIPNEIKIPTWYILGLQTSQQSIANLSNITNQDYKLSNNSASIAQFQNNFNLFTIPQSIRAVLPKMPPLNTKFIGNKTNSNTLLSEANNALWQFFPGEKPFCILNGEGLWHWSIYEFKNFQNQNVTFDLIKQTLSFLQVEKNDKPFQISVLKNNISDNESAVIIAELKNKNGELITDPEAKLYITNNGKTIDYNFEKIGNSYRIQAGLLAPGDYQLKGSVKWNNQNYEDFGLLHVSDIPLEALRTHADYELMYNLAIKNNGAFFTQINFSSIVDSINNNPNIKTIIHSQSQKKPIVDEKWIFFLILLLASIEWFIRKYKGMNG